MKQIHSTNKPNFALQVLVMKIIVIAGVEMQKEFESKGIAEGIEVHFETSVPVMNSDADAWFYLLEEAEPKNYKDLLNQTNAPVFINAVVTTLHHLPANAIRINTWPGFLQRSLVEICTSKQNEEAAGKILQALNWNYQIVPDTPGMISAKIISLLYQYLLCC